MGLRITVVDEDTGEEEIRYVARGDYCVIAAAPCEVTSVSTSGHGSTHQIIVKHRTAR